MLPPFSCCFKNTSEDGYVRFAVVSEYFGRGLFNKVTVVTEAPTPSPPQSSSVSETATLSYGPGAEARLRLQEGQSKEIFVSNTAKQIPPKGTSIVPVPEGRMRVLEQQKYSSSLEAHLTRLEPVHVQKDRDSPISSAISNGNPFEEYDETKNPFADESDPTNPFENDDYDKNLNPFAS